MTYLVSEMRAWVRNDVPKEFRSPGWYTWWADEQTSKKLFGKFHKTLWPRMTDGKGECTGMKLVYVGITGVSLKSRVLGGHIRGRNTVSAIRSSGLSAFRKSIGSLLCDNLLLAQSITNQTLDKMRVCVYATDVKKAEESERVHLRSHVVPLNTQNNRNDVPDLNLFLAYLRDRRRVARQNALAPNAPPP